MGKLIPSIPIMETQELKSLKAESIPNNISQIGSSIAWEISKGEGIVVAVLDSGLTIVPDIDGQIIDGKNFVLREGLETDYQDLNGHGNHVAGIIAASENDNQIVGVAPKAKLLIGKIADKEGWVEASELIEAIDWVINWEGPNGEKVKVINMSLAFLEEEITADEKQALHDVCIEAINVGISVVCAASNEGDGSDTTNEIAYPSYFPEVITVGAVDSNDKIASFSNSHEFIDLAAPGVTIPSLSLKANSLAVMSGTSQATPHVAGALALIYSAYEKAGQPLTEAEAYDVLINKYVKDTTLSAKNEGFGILTFKKNLLPYPVDWVQPEEPFVDINSNEIQPALFYINAPKIWKWNQGKDSVVAILSTGVETVHDSIRHKIMDGKNFTSDYNGDVTNYSDNHGRGTFYAGLIAGRSGVGQYVGLAPQAKLIVGKIQKSDLTFDVVKVAEAIDWAINWRGTNGEKIRVMQITIQTETNYIALQNAITRATDAGITVVAGAGDTNKATPVYPAYYDNVISVSAGQHFATSASSNDRYIYGTSYNAGINLSAPGDDFQGVWVNGNSIPYGENKGTNVSASVVTGAIALLISHYKEQGNPLTNRNSVWTELQKYIRKINYAVNVVGLGTLDFDENYLPGTSPEENITYVFPKPIQSNIVPPTVTVGEVTYESVSLSWDYEPTTGVDEMFGPYFDDVYYQIKRDGIVIGETKSLQTFTDLSITELTSHNYTIIVMNENGFIVENNVTVNVPGRSIKILSQVSLAHMKAELKVKGDSQDEVIEAKMEIAKDFLIAETFCTLEELDAKPMAVGVFTRLVSDLFYERMTTAQVKENPTYRAMLKRISKVVI